MSAGPFRPYHYRYMTEPSRSYWVQRLKGLNTPFNDESNDVCLVKLLTKLNKSLQSVHMPSAEFAADDSNQTRTYRPRL